MVRIPGSGLTGDSTRGRKSGLAATTNVQFQAATVRARRLMFRISRKDVHDRFDVFENGG